MTRIKTAVQRAIKAHQTATPADAGVAALALAYASVIDDDGQDIQKIGPLLLVALEALLMSPRARAAVMRGAPSAVIVDAPIDEIRRRRAQRRARLDQAADLDTTSS